MLSLIAPGAFEVDGSYTKNDIIRILKENVAIVWLEVLKFDRYGRSLGNLYFSPEDTEPIKARCIRENHCKPYFGKTKKQWVAEDCKLNECAGSTATATVPSP